MRPISKHPLLSFFVLSYLFSWLVGIPQLLSARGIIGLHIPQAVEALAAFGPFAAAVVVLWVCGNRRGMHDLFVSLRAWRVSSQWFAFACLSPFAVMFTALALTDGTGALFSEQLAAELFVGSALFELLIVSGLAQGLGEEPGWRGFALPLLRKRFGPLLASLAIFPVWLCWHLPFFLARPEFQLGAWIGFSAGIFAAAVWCTFIYDATRSVLMLILWHALINITRAISLAVSMEAFLMFGQVVFVVAAIVVVYWLIARPSTYNERGGNNPQQQIL
ncbi:MAG: type II CAAX endopeptidase family protein [Gammaproteobacteria bacterium]|jgi:membrane protease YdiL (CAAX protease family)|nr:type II CAAX endopeptidase family protein [Gammaproteobacteria bacterium]MDP6616936.1 type II CAAX endopeptidase family protein [Gammaproteobacteria bacterium]MDP6696040.1 type II CAAX endopeptidase family protein [Gammaproteobacteria bacterium]MDP7041178.1 type II CAAX endopeptidase family protein [Gammaproteobacteria bacterium]